MEKAARAERKRALVDMNAHETQEGVMDSLMEALQTGSAFSRPDQRRKRQTRVAGGKFKFVRNTKFNTLKFVKRRNDSPQCISRKGLYSKSSMNEDDLLSRKTLQLPKSNQVPTLLIDKEEYYTPEENKTMYKQMLMRQAMMTPKKDKHGHQSNDKIDDKGFIENEMFYTPEENQNIYKQILLRFAEKAPKKDEVFSRVSGIHKKKSTAPKIDFRSPVLETPKREVPLTVSLSKLQIYNEAQILETSSANSEDNFGNTPKDFCHKVAYKSVINEFKDWSPDRFKKCSSSEKSLQHFSRKENLNETYGSTPVRKKILASKKKKRNSIVRRTILNRKNISQKHVSKSKFSPNWHSFSNISVSPSVMEGLPNSKFTKSCDNITNLCDLKSYEFQMARSNNFENIIYVRDENENLPIFNLIDPEATSFTPSPCSKSVSTDDLVKSSYNEDISGIIELSRVPRPRFPNLDVERKIILSDNKGDQPSEESEASPYRPNSSKSQEILSPEMKFYRGSIVPQIEGKKKTWKLWRKIGNSAKIVSRKYNVLHTTDTEGFQKVKQSIDQMKESTNSRKEE